MIIPGIFFALLFYSLSGNRNVHIVFWLALALMFDPGGILNNKLGGVFFGPVKYFDAFFLLMTICFLLAKDIHIKEMKSDRYFMKLIKYFIFFELYYVFIFGWLTPLLNGINADNNFPLFILKQRTSVYGLFIAIYVYLFAKRRLIFHYKITVYSALICLSLFIFGFVTGISLIPSETSQRYSGDEMMRVYMASYGLFDIILTMALVHLIFIRKYCLKLPYRKGLYFGGLLMLVVFMLTLTRRTLIEIFFLPIIVLWFTALITNTTIRLFRVILPLVFSVLLLGIIAPKYLKWIPNIYRDISMVLFTGKDTRGEEEYRVSGTGNMVYVKESIKERPFLGTGFYWMNYEERDKRVGAGDTFAAAWGAAGEVPIYWVFFNQGILGFLMYVPVYFFILHAMLSLFKLFKSRYKEFIVTMPIVSLIGITVFVEFIEKFTVRAYNLFGDLSGPKYMLSVGLLFSIWFIFRNNYYEAIKPPSSGKAEKY